MKIQKLTTQRTLEIKQKFQVTHLAAQVLASKQLNDEQIYDILKKPQLSDPYLAYNLDLVISRLQQAKLRHEKVMVCGDYDCDGVCATAILVDALKRYGIQVGFYIPDRFKEGYGLHEHTVEAANQKGYSLLITVDNGVKAHAALRKAKQLNLDVIVSDHHTIEETVECNVLLHPSLMDDVFSTLSGAGVALLIARALVGDIKEHIVLACVAAIGDVMCVLKETRAIIKLGIQYLQEGVCLPIQLLQDKKAIWTSQQVAFQIVPKLNAAGRLADRANVNNIVRYLLCNDMISLHNMAKQINQINTLRKDLSNQMAQQAQKLIQPQYRFQLLIDESFHEGLNGVVAGRLTEQLQQPVLVASVHQNELKGSIRSIDGVDLRTFFQDCPFLKAYGGHEKAAGIAILYEDKQRLQDYVNTKIQTIEIKNEKTYDVIEGNTRYLTISEIESLDCLMPFGEGFQEPLFYLEKMYVKGRKLLQNMHSKWSLEGGFEAMKFHSQAVKQSPNINTMTFIGTLQVSEFLNQKKINILVKEEFPCEL